MVYLLGYCLQTPFWSYIQINSHNQNAILLLLCTWKISDKVATNSSSRQLNLVSKLQTAEICQVAFKMCRLQQQRSSSTGSSPSDAGDSTQARSELEVAINKQWTTIIISVEHHCANNRSADTQCYQFHP